MHSWRRWRWAAASAVLGVGAACGGGHGQATAPVAGCTTAVNERLDPKSTIHLFPGAPEPRYLTDPPTSGPHQLGQPFQGVVTAPISRPRQVAMLESGFVLLQFQGLPPGQAQILGTLTGPLVTAAPPVAPLPAAVVATAWTWKLECGSVSPTSVAAIKAFIAAHQGVGFNQP